MAATRSLEILKAMGVRGGVVSRTVEDGGVVRMKILVKRQELEQVVERVVKKRDDNRRQLSRSLASKSLEPKIKEMKKTRISDQVNGDCRSHWRPALHSIPEEFCFKPFNVNMFDILLGATSLALIQEGVVSQMVEDGGVVRMKILVKRRELEQVLEHAMKKRDGNDDVNLRRLTRSRASKSLEQRLQDMKRMRIVRGSQVHRDCGRVVSQTVEHNGVVRMKILVKRQQLEQVLEQVVKKTEATKGIHVHLRQLSKSSASKSLEQRLNALKRMQIQRSGKSKRDCRGFWKPSLHSIPEAKVC
ncbi:hypothetical protein Ccrd_001381, partial [Cynara cardunculus var. scolymus]